MSSFNAPSHSWLGYIGDPETGILHCRGFGCAHSEDGLFFLDWRSAIVRGYRLCSHCALQLSTASTPADLQDGTARWQPRSRQA